jgi:hypothetical protein
MNLSTLMESSGSGSNRKLSSKKDSNKKLSRQKEQSDDEGLSSDNNRTTKTVERGSALHLDRLLIHEGSRALFNKLLGGNSIWGFGIIFQNDSDFR